MGEPERAVAAQLSWGVGGWVGVPSGSAGGAALQWVEGSSRRSAAATTGDCLIRCALTPSAETEGAPK